MESGYVKEEIKNGIGVIEFFHPLHNSLTLNLLNQLKIKITELGENPELRVIILKSAGDRTFCAGASFNELLEIEGIDDAKKFFSGFAEVFLAMKNCSKIIITSVQGKTVGGGVGLIAASDYVCATSNAEIKLSELSIGFGPFVIGPLVERKIGISNFSKLSLNPTKFFSSDWSLNTGLFFQLCKDLNELNTAVEKKALEIASYHLGASSALKEIFWENTKDLESVLKSRVEMSANLALSENTKNQLRHFKEKSSRKEN